MDVPVFFYRLLATLLTLITLPQAIVRRQARARLGAMPAAQGPHIWLHGASNGELASVKPIVVALRQLRPDLGILVTSNTQTGVDLVRSWDVIGVTAHLSPLDLSWVSARIMRDWRVKSYVSLESELWPHRILSCPGPVIQLAARMSESTARGWGRLPKLAQRVLGRFDYVSAQDGASLGRLFDLGLAHKAGGTVVDLKAFYVPPKVTLPPDLTTTFPRDKTWLAASTHEGEEEIVLEAHKQALAHIPDLKLILAPRHPRRADEILKLAKGRGLQMAQRSKDDAPGSIYLADTMGEMPLWYSLAGRVFVAGSLAPKGGHTPYEPSAFGCALIHGPDTGNFRAAYARLRDQDAALEVSSASDLADALIALAPPTQQADFAARSADALAQDVDPAGLIRDVLAALAAA